VRGRGAKAVRVEEGDAASVSGASAHCVSSSCILALRQGASTSCHVMPCAGNAARTRKASAVVADAAAGGGAAAASAVDDAAPGLAGAPSRECMLSVLTRQ
jgi:hypothetical protein